MGEPKRPRGTRVGIVVSQLGYGGAERQTALLLERLAESPWRPDIVCCLSEAVEPYGPLLQRLGYPLAVLPRRRSFELGRLLALRRLIRRERLTLVHAVHLLASGYAFLATRGCRGVRLLPSARGTVVWPARVKRVIYRAMFRSCPRTLVNSSAGARFLVERYAAPPERIVVIPNGIDVEAIAREARRGPQVRRKAGVPPDRPLLLFVGKDAPVKNVPRFLEVLRRLRSAGVPACGWLVGAGLTPAAVRRLAPDLAATAARGLGPRSDVPALLGAADALVLTSDSEGCPNVVLEALAAGTPVVAADVGDIRDMVAPGETGFVVPAGDPDRYVEALCEVIARRDSFAARVAARRQALAERWGVPAMVERTIALWAELARPGAAPPAEPRDAVTPPDPTPLRPTRSP